MIPLHPPMARHRLASWRWPRHVRQSVTLFTLLVLFPALALAQSGTPFDTGFTNLQTLFTGTIAKVASLIAIVIGGYQFAHGKPGREKNSGRSGCRHRVSPCSRPTFSRGSGHLSAFGFT